jgi:hypothetical protein
MFRSLVMLIALTVSSHSGQDNQAARVAANNAPRLSGIHTLTDANELAVIQAVEDEIYDYGFSEQFYEIGTNVGRPDHWISKIPIYIDPNTDKDGNGRVVYRLMPDGEVFRLFFMRRDGIVVLIGDPDNGFPITEPSKLTVFMNDDEICSMKHRWFRGSILIDEKPSLETIESAARRQETRIGFSAWKAKAPTAKKSQ